MSNKNLNWAVIPCAGLGTRLMPVTRSVPKAMLPVGNYPIIHFAVKEAISIGIENILIIIGDGMDTLRSYFSEIENMPKSLDEENINIEEMIKSSDIRFLLQEKPLGVGHAIKLTKRIIGDNSFAVILPDDLIFSKPNSLQQLKKIYDKHGGHVIGLNELKSYLDNKITLQTVKELIIIKTRQYAKRQSTWARGKMSLWIKLNPYNLNLK